MAEQVAQWQARRLAAAAEARSGHPLAEAVLGELERRGLANDLEVEAFENIAGFGVRTRSLPFRQHAKRHRA